MSESHRVDKVHLEATCCHWHTLFLYTLVEWLQLEESARCASIEVGRPATCMRWDPQWPGLVDVSPFARKVEWCDPRFIIRTVCIQSVLVSLRQSYTFSSMVYSELLLKHNLPVVSILCGSHPLAFGGRDVYKVTSIIWWQNTALGTLSRVDTRSSRISSLSTQQT